MTAEHFQPLSGRHALITGASRGIGLAISRELARLGVDITLAARDADRLRANAATIAADFGVSATPLTLDLSADDLAGALPGQPVDILVNNAGIAPANPFHKQDLEEWRRVFEVNVTAAFRLSQAAVGTMKENDWGRIVNIASTAGLTGYPFVAAYVSSKHAMIGLTRSLALELAKTGITVNAVCPGYTETDMAAGAIENIVAGGKSEDEARRILARNNPQGRLIDPDEVAQAVGWLCLPGSSAITGQSIAVAGGEIM